MIDYQPNATKYGEFFKQEGKMERNRIEFLNTESQKSDSNNFDGGQCSSSGEECSDIGQHIQNIDDDDEEEEYYYEEGEIDQNIQQLIE